MEEKKDKVMYIQVPIAGRNYEEAKKEAQQRALIAENAGFYTLTPFQVVDDPDVPVSKAMGECIEELLKCDAILAHPWAERNRIGEEGDPYSKGCALELLAAAIYGIEIYELNDDGELELSTVVARNVAAEVLYGLAEHLLMFMSKGGENSRYLAKGKLLHQAAMVAETMCQDDKMRAIYEIAGSLAELGKKITDREWGSTVLDRFADDMDVAPTI